MTTIHYTVGDATRPAGDGVRIIAHVCNDIGGWGKGFVLALSRRWREPERAFRRWYASKEPAFELGAMQLVPVDTDLYVANMVAQRGIKASPAGPPIRYEALRECLATLADEAAILDASLHMPRIGCGLAGGKWPQVEALIEETAIARGIPVTVYDLA